MFAEQSDWPPPLIPAQVQLQPVAFVNKDDELPIAQRFAVGASAIVLVLTVPQTPLTGLASTVIGKADNEAEPRSLVAVITILGKEAISATVGVPLKVPETVSNVAQEGLFRILNPAA